MLRRGLCRAVSTARCTRRTDYAGNCARITECPILDRYRWPAMLQEAILARSRESSSQSAANYLALSGGSDNGAFGAGVLGGWTILGTRPTFKLLTGVSTGALIAPFAFLGPAYDPELRAVYTEISPEDVFERRGLISAVFHDALTSTDPLFHLISRYANQDMLNAIATEYQKGRLLLIGTTNLDATPDNMEHRGNCGERQSRRLSFCSASTSSSRSRWACWPRGHRQVLPSGKPCKSGSNRSTLRVGCFHLLPLSQSVTPFCGTGAITDHWFPDRERHAANCERCRSCQRSRSTNRFRRGCEANSRERHPLPQRLVTLIRKLSTVPP
jgi:hypothetical protein